MNDGGNGEGDWKAQYNCNNCKLPVAKWDNGVWAHIRMGQVECYIDHPLGPKANPNG
jgi:hypothetical protein